MNSRLAATSVVVSVGQRVEARQQPVVGDRAELQVRRLGEVGRGHDVVEHRGLAVTQRGDAAVDRTLDRERAGRAPSSSGGRRTPARRSAPDLPGHGVTRPQHQARQRHEGVAELGPDAGSPRRRHREVRHGRDRMHERAVDELVEHRRVDPGGRGPTRVASSRRTVSSTGRSPTWATRSGSMRRVSTRFSSGTRPARVRKRPRPTRRGWRSSRSRCPGRNGPNGPR